jgi:hypothetical protein
VLALAGCAGCGPPPATDDGGTAGGDGGGSPVDAGVDAGSPGDDSGSPTNDAGNPNDGGAGGGDAGRFDWEDLFGEAGVPEELACLPGTLPDATGGVTGILSSLDLHTYNGSPETGVVCGDTTCAADVPCCVLCGWAQCAEVPADGGAPTCPAFTLEFTCDGKEDCSPGADTCCFSLDGTSCTTREECTFDLSFLDGGLPDLFGDGGLFSDGGFNNPFDDAGTDAGYDAGVDAGDLDAGDLDAATDAGADAGATVDAGANDAGASDAGAFDAGAFDAGFDAGPELGDIVGELLDQGVKVCHSSFEFISPSCDILSGEVCCTSDRFVSVDIGLCVPLLVCAGGGF